MERFITLADGKDYEQIPLSEVIYLEAAAAYTIFHLKCAEKGEQTKQQSYHLGAYEDKLNTNFYRIGRSYIINRQFISRITPKGLITLRCSDLSIALQCSKTIWKTLKTILIPQFKGSKKR